MNAKEKRNLRVQRHRLIKKEMQKYENQLLQCQNTSSDQILHVQTNYFNQKYTDANVNGDSDNSEISWSSTFHTIEKNIGKRYNDYDALSVDNTNNWIESLEDVSLLDDALSTEDNQQRKKNSIKEISELREWAICFNIPQTALDALMSILRQRLLPELPKSSKTLLQTKSDYDIHVILNEQEEEIGQFVYFGLEKGIRSCVNTTLHNNKEIYLQFNVDGLPILNSSKKQFWPILCKIFSKIDIYKPFVVAIYCGDSKPTNIQEFFSQFVTDLNNILNNEFIINKEAFIVKVHSFICDTPARSFLKMTKGHGGFSACERCTVRGTRCEKRTVYDSAYETLRTDASFRNQTDREHHNGYTPLINIEPKINMISHFVLDPMHLCSGVMKKLIEYWTLICGKARISRTEKKEISRRMLCLKNDMPFEFQRRPRCVEDVRMWKATEFRFFLLYCGPIVLKYVLPKMYYNHFLLLHTAFRILFSEYYATYNDEAKLYLLKFFEALPYLYGRRSQILNMHNLIHIADDAKTLNCNLNYINCFPFENFLKVIKHYIRKSDKPLAQVCRRLSESKMRSEKPSIPLFVEILKVRKVMENTAKVVISKLKIKGLYVITDTHPNNVVLLQDNTILRIKRIVDTRANENSEIIIQGTKVATIKNIYTYPTNSRDLKMYEILKFSSHVTTYSINCIQQKCLIFSLQLKECKRKQTFILSMLH